MSDSVHSALAGAYDALSCIHFQGMHYRHDIGQRQAVLSFTDAKDLRI